MVNQTEGGRYVKEEYSQAIGVHVERDAKLQSPTTLVIFFKFEVIEKADCDVYSRLGCGIINS